MFGVSSSNSVNKTISRLTKLQGGSIFSDLNRYGQLGIDALSNATPRSSGETAQSWRYRVVQNKGQYKIEWFNTNINQGVQIAVLIQYGHGTGTGGWVEGYDYINPAIRPIFDKILADVQRKVKA